MSMDPDQFAKLLISQLPFYALGEARKRKWPPDIYRKWLRSTRADRRMARLAKPPDYGVTL